LNPGKRKKSNAKENKQEQLIDELLPNYKNPITACILDSGNNFEEKFENTPKNHLPFIYHAMSEMPDLSTFLSFLHGFETRFWTKYKPCK